MRGNQNIQQNNARLIKMSLLLTTTKSNDRHFIIIYFERSLFLNDFRITVDYFTAKTS